MPNMETPNELADYLADLLGIYADPRCKDSVGIVAEEHVTDCNCRVWWVPNMAQRIRDAAINEKVLDAILEAWK